MTRIRSLSSTDNDGITNGQVTFLLTSDGGLVIESEQWGSDEEGTPCIYTTAVNLSGDEADNLREWINQVKR